MSREEGRPPRARVLGAVLAAAVVAGACGRDASSPGPGRAASPSPGQASSEVTLQPVTLERWQQELARLRGEIVVVDHWATWCVPCLERFPTMVAMAREYGPRGVRFLSLCLDDRDDPDALAHAREFLSRQDAGFPHYLMDEPITQSFEKLDLLGIPAVFAYGRDGALRHRLTGDDPRRQFTDEDVEEAIRRLLGEAPGR